MTNIEFYEKCSEILGVNFEDRSFTHYRRTRWNNRVPGNGRFKGFGLIRCFGDRVHIAINKPKNIHKICSKQEAIDLLKEIMDV